MAEAPLLELELPELEVLEPELEVLEPELEVLEPELEVLEPELEVLEPELDVLEPELDVLEPELVEPELVDPPMPELEVEPLEPELEVLEPELEVLEPELVDPELVDPELLLPPVRVTVAEALRLLSASATAVTVTVGEGGNCCGAKYSPEVEIVPTLTLPPVTPLTCQMTAVSVECVTVARKVSVLPRATLADVGEMAMPTDGAVPDTLVVPLLPLLLPPPPQAARSDARMVAVATQAHRLSAPGGVTERRRIETNMIPCTPRGVSLS